MAVRQTPPDESANAASDAPDARPGATDAGDTATFPSGTPAGGSSGGESAGPTPPRTPPPFDGGAGFFGWLRSLGVVRTPGWLGGVASGVSARLGIDPVIARGVLVVCALFGVPVFLLYGLAWALLPDETGRIHLEQLFRGIFDSALIGIAVFLLLGLSPFAVMGNSLVGDTWNSVQYGSFWTSSPWIYGLRVLWTLALIGAIAALVVWLVRRTRSASDTTASTTPEAAFAQYEAEAAAAHAPSAFAAPEAATVLAPASPTAAEPARPVQPVGAPVGTGEYEAWKAQHEAWRIDHAAWRQSQADANRAARAQLAAENKVRAAAFAAQAGEARRVRILTRPRTSFAYIVAAFGAALVAGALTAIAALGAPALVAYAATIGLLVATIVLALSMVLAGILRRRSGFLASVTIVLLVVSLCSAAIPRTDHLALGSVNEMLSTSTSILQPAGNVYLQADGTLADRQAPPTLDLTQGAGTIHLDIRDGARVRVELECGNCSVGFTTVDADGNSAAQPGLQLAKDNGPSTWTGAVGTGLTPGSADATLHVRTGAAQITIVDFAEFDAAGKGNR